MGPTLETLAVPDSSYLDAFGDPIVLTHRAFYFTFNPWITPFVSGDAALTICSVLGKRKGLIFRAHVPSALTTIHNTAETLAIVQTGGFLAAVVAAHKAKLAIA